MFGSILSFSVSNSIYVSTAGANPAGDVHRKTQAVIRYLVEAQVVLDGVRGVEDGATGSEDQDEAIESLQVKHRINTDDS